MSQDKLDEKFLQEQRSRFQRMFREKHKQGFVSASQFANWCVERLETQNGRCAYCGTHIGLICKIIEMKKTRAGVVVFHKLREVRGGGVRGRSLEIERRDPSKGYSRENCSLVCYFCNNDKSYVYGEEDYRKFFGPARKLHFEEVARRLGIVE